jgi:hypothetical protein
MKTEAIPISQFRVSLSSLCKAVRSGKKKLVVTRHREPIFEVTQPNENQAGVEFGLLKVREHVADFLDLFEETEIVFLTAWGKRRVACKKL